MSISAYRILPKASGVLWRLYASPLAYCLKSTAGSSTTVSIDCEIVSQLPMKIKDFADRSERLFLLQQLTRHQRHF
jgi:hypothetical protein